MVKFGAISYNTVFALLVSQVYLFVVFFFSWGGNYVVLSAVEI